MSYGVITTVMGSLVDYDRIHAAAIERTGGILGGLLLHVGRETADGYQIIEVWENREQSEACNRTIIWPLIAEMVAGQPAIRPMVEEFEPRGLILSGGRIAH